MADTGYRDFIPEGEDTGAIGGGFVDFKLAEEKKAIQVQDETPIRQKATELYKKEIKDYKEKEAKVEGVPPSDKPHIASKGSSVKKTK